MATLYTSTTSPYGRIVLLIAKLYGVDLKVELVSPLDLPEVLTAINPFSQVPTLLLDNGDVITETALIIQAITPQVYTDNSSYNLPRIAKALTILFQGVRVVSLTRFAHHEDRPHPFVQRSCELLGNALPNLPTLQADSQESGDKILLCALAWIGFRLPEVFDTLSDANKHAVATFANTDLMKQTSPEALELLA